MLPVVLLCLFASSWAEWNWRDHLSSETPDAVSRTPWHLPKGRARYPTYTLYPMPNVGCEVKGLNLQQKMETTDPLLIVSLRNDLIECGFLLFRNQGILSPQTQMELTQWFGRVPTTGKLARFSVPSYISNDPAAGETNVATGGWQTDGYCSQYPYRHVLLHALNVTDDGNTLFASIPQALNSMPQKFKKFLSQLSFKFTTGAVKDRKSPLLVYHPTSKNNTLQFYFGPKCYREVVIDRGTISETEFTPKERKLISKYFNSIFQQPNLVHHHQWAQGDFLVMDNWLVAHLETPETQSWRRNVGLRLLQKSITFPESNIEGYAVREVGGTKS